MFIALWAIPLIYALQKLPSCMRNGEITIRGIYNVLLFPLPLAAYTMVRGVRKIRLGIAEESSIGHCQTTFIPYIRIKGRNIAILQLLNVIEGLFHLKTSGEKGEKLPWESILLLQRVLFSLCHTFVLQPGMKSSLLLLFIIIFSFLNIHYRPFGSGFLNSFNGITFIFLCITGIMNATYAFMYEYSCILYGSLVQLLRIFDYLEVTILCFHC